MYLVVISTAGNQRYIFASGKRQEIVGASGLITRVDGTWADESLEEVFPGFSRKDWRIGGHDAELLVAGAGGITVLVRNRDAGRRLVTELTCRALKEAPGLDICGVVIEYTPGTLAETMRRARVELAAVRETRPGPLARFLRLPLVEDCGSSGLPATEIRREGEGEPAQPRSAAAMAKLAAHPAALNRMAGISGADRPTMKKIVDRLGLEAEWVAVVHADGNGLGEVFQRLGEPTAAGSGDASGEAGIDRDRRYADAIRNLSSGVDGCAKRAFRAALRRTAGELGEEASSLPVLPLVLGGDDLTVVCDGAVALSFTRHYLEAFEWETARDPLLAPTRAKLGREDLSAAAGVAIVKRNYPFHFAYELAERLTDAEAKRVKAWSSAVAFVVLFESSAPDLERIRRSVTLSGGSGTSASPYLVGRGSRDDRARGRRWEDLVRRVTALTRRDSASGELLIPRGAAHDLREGLHLGEEVAGSRLDLLRRRYAGDAVRTRALAELTEEQGGLMWTAPGEGRVTGLLDAMAALPFLRVREGAR
ncbi:hypothetical protein [Sphaerisporangium sp. NPDC051011]|uniref:Cas10/Cmr2 second palm domain-containing protein n=1 Tax=Sphaerisporangium sp. NPDC051011 TaxID=3155792 RepID=UPI0033CD21EA